MKSNFFRLRMIKRPGMNLTQIVCSRGGGGGGGGELVGVGGGGGGKRGGAEG